MLTLCLLTISSLANFGDEYDDIRHTVPTSLSTLITGPRRQFCVCKKKVVGNSLDPAQSHGNLGSSQAGLPSGISVSFPGNFASNESRPNAAQNEWSMSESIHFLNHTRVTGSVAASNPYDQETVIPTEQMHHLRIRNIVMITLESTRSEAFPIQNNTRFLDEVYSHRAPHQAYAEPLDATPFAKSIFGDQNDGTPAKGIVVQGAESSSSYTLKSMLASHCGVSPLAVDFMEEVTGSLHQPCFAHVLKEWSTPSFPTRGDGNNHTQTQVTHGNGCREEWCAAPWDTHFVQSTIIGYDRQKAVMKMMGFDTGELLSKETLELPTAKYPIPNETINPGEWSFPETVTMPYIRDLIRKSRVSGNRLFLSHLTSTTHYPFRSPKSWTNRKYTEHSDLNNYLNTIAWSDSWVEELFGVMKTEGIADETLVIISGDQ